MSESGEVYWKRTDVERTYRSASVNDLIKFRVVVGESDLWVMTDQDLQDELADSLKFFRRQLKEYIYTHPAFLRSLTPLPDDNQAPELICRMIRASAAVGVGPMAAVAGAIADIIGSRFPPDKVPELIIENGGDIYLRSRKERVVAVYAGTQSSFSGKIGILVPPQPEGMGICTSAGTFGPSLSFGKADAVTIIASGAALADAAATAGANRISTSADFSKTIAFLQKIPGIRGILLIKDQKMAVWGEVELVPVEDILK